MYALPRTVVKIFDTKVKRSRQNAFEARETGAGLTEEASAAGGWEQSTSATQN